MRKAIITLLAVLMLISFVSCNDQKVTEEMREQAMRDFVATFDVSGKYLLEYSTACEYDLSNWNSTTADFAEKYQINSIIEEFVGTDDITSAEGTVAMKNVSTIPADSGLKGVKILADMVVKNVKIIYTENGKEESLTLDYDMSVENVMDLQTFGTDLKTDVELVVRNFNLNGTKYRPIVSEFSVDNLWTGEGLTVTKAVCDGIELDCAKVKELIENQSV